MDFFNKLSVFFKKKKCKDFGCVIVDEVIPQLHDYARTANKTIYRLDSIVEQNKGVFSTENTNITRIFSKFDFITQNNKPIMIYDAFFKTGDFDQHFSKDNYKVGYVYKFTGLGYLGNLNNTGIIKLVTDQYVIFETNTGITFYSYQELKRLHKTRVV